MSGTERAAETETASAMPSQEPPALGLSSLDYQARDTGGSMKNLYNCWLDPIDLLESAERYAALFLVNGWDYTTSLRMPNYSYEDYEQ